MPKHIQQARIAVTLLLFVFLYYNGWFFYSLIGKGFAVFQLHSGSIFAINSWLRIMLNLFGLVVCIAFLSGNYSMARYVRALALLVFYSVIVSQLYLLLLNFIHPEMTLYISSRNAFRLPWYTYISAIAAICISCYTGIVMGNFFAASSQHVTIAGEVLEEQATVASSGTRFLNRIIDAAIVLHIFISLNGFGISRADNLAIIVWDFSLTLLFYALLECIFKTTPGKILTGCTVVNAEGDSPNVGIMFGRTICRFIPFDAFSFLGSGRGWHDSIPDVYVVHDEMIDGSTKKDLLAGY